MRLEHIKSGHQCTECCISQSINGIDGKIDWYHLSIGKVNSVFLANSTRVWVNAMQNILLKCREWKWKKNIVNKDSYLHWVYIVFYDSFIEIYIKNLQMHSRQNVKSSGKQRPSIKYENGYFILPHLSPFFKRLENNQLTFVPIVICLVSRNSFFVRSFVLSFFLSFFLYLFLPFFLSFCLFSFSFSPTVCMFSRENITYPGTFVCFLSIESA